MSKRTRHALVVAALLGLTLGLVGCINPFFPNVSSTRAAPEPAPTPDSPQNVLRLLRWCWENRAYTEYQGIFTKDYRFAFSQTDSSGAAYQDWAMTRDEDLHAALNLFQGTPESQKPPAQRIVLYFDPNLFAQIDGRPGKLDPWHKVIRTSVNLTIDNGTETWRVTGYGLYFVVRGDSANVSDDLVPNLARDASRWYIERWEDQTGSAGGAAVQPATPEAAVRPGAGVVSAAAVRRPPTAEALSQTVTWGYVKRLFSF